jgi:hypothetical protein
VPLAVGLKEDILNHVFGIVGIAAEAGSEAEQAGAVEFQELGNCGRDGLAWPGSDGAVSGPFGGGASGIRCEALTFHE